jgi:hypothetical protein
MRHPILDLTHRRLRPANDNVVAVGILLAPLEIAGVLRNGAHETLISVESGVVEFVIGGNVGTVTAGGCARIPAGSAYTYRNAGREFARLVAQRLVSGQVAGGR